MNYLVNRYIEKIAVRVHRIGKTKAYLVAGKDAQEFLARLGLKKRKGISEGQIGEIIKGMLGRGTVRGTSSGGKAYIYFKPLSTEQRKHLRTVSWFKPGGHRVGHATPGGLYETIRHELAHLHPIVGKSETYAHMVGGLRRERGGFSPSGAVKSYRELWRSRPRRAAKELAIIGAGTLGIGGGAFGVKKLVTKKDKADELLSQ